jgi:hypothetical protein
VFLLSASKSNAGHVTQGIFGNAESCVKYIAVPPASNGMWKVILPDENLRFTETMVPISPNAPQAKIWAEQMAKQWNMGVKDGPGIGG